MKTPLISIIIPCYNQGHFLLDCVYSIIAQEFEDWEAILVNDGSTDQTEAIGADLVKKYIPIQYIEQKNQGLSAARNTGMKIAKGEFLLFLDADDWLEPNCLKSYAHVIQSNLEIKLFRCGYAYWDKHGGRRFHSHLPSYNGNIYPSVLTHNIGPCHSILIRRNFAELMGGFDPALKSCEDWDFWIRAGKMGVKIVSIQKVLVAYRYVLTSMSRNPCVMYEALSEVSDRAGRIDTRLPKGTSYNQEYDLNISEIQKNHLIRMIGVLLQQGKVEEAVEWYAVEEKKWGWKIKKEDWKGLSSYLSWAYFFEKEQIEKLLRESLSKVQYFFQKLQYSKDQSVKLSRMVFLPQIKKRNHVLYGRIGGALINRLSRF
ncbi:glycosyltransferase family 2 protein [Algoriphagus sp. PAP.12]|uniref:glycosyltransferase family 2 protein n=1 Tax=Algoriphagus sp. PAP.12 TaxID=2996678 RepID=UPI00227C4178|nr:glycosyltransferase [Algoriphagus sp. PAP.12]